MRAEICLVRVSERSSPVGLLALAGGGKEGNSFPEAHAAAELRGRSLCLRLSLAAASDEFSVCEHL